VVWQACKSTAMRIDRRLISDIDPLSRLPARGLSPQAGSDHPGGHVGRMGGLVDVYG
jgi:hypothetical protein